MRECKEYRSSSFDACFSHNGRCAINMIEMIESLQASGAVMWHSIRQLHDNSGTARSVHDISRITMKGAGPERTGSSAPDTSRGIPLGRDFGP
jgi:hypothetical protein